MCLTVLLLLPICQAPPGRLRALILLNARTLLGRRRDQACSIPYPVFYVMIAIPGIGKVMPYISQFVLVLVLVFILILVFLHMHLPSFPMEAKKVSMPWLMGWCVRRPAPD